MLPEQDVLLAFSLAAAAFRSGVTCNRRGFFIPGHTAAFRDISSATASGNMAPEGKLLGVEFGQRHDGLWLNLWDWGQGAGKCFLRTFHFRANRQWQVSASDETVRVQRSSTAAGVVYTVEVGRAAPRVWGIIVLLLSLLLSSLLLLPGGRLVE